MTKHQFNLPTIEELIADEIRSILILKEQIENIKVLGGPAFEEGWLQEKLKEKEELLRRWKPEIRERKINQLLGEEEATNSL